MKNHYWPIWDREKVGEKAFIHKERENQLISIKFGGNNTCYMLHIVKFKTSKQLNCHENETKKKKKKQNLLTDLFWIAKQSDRSVLWSICKRIKSFLRHFNIKIYSNPQGIHANANISFQHDKIK